VTRTRALVPAAALSAGLTAALLAGCAGATTPSAATSPATTAGAVTPSAAGTSGTAAATSAVTEQAAATSSDAAPSSVVADTQPDTQTASDDARLTVRAVRVARQDGFDRVVLELGGTGTPGWDVRWVDAATDQAKGDPVPVSGGAVLQVSVTGAGYPYDTGVAEVPSRVPVRGAGTRDVTEVVPMGTFEGTTQVVVGAAARTPFRVYALTSPTRIVLDVTDPS
jgi:hypothetical protein